MKMRQDKEAYLIVNVQVKRVTAKAKPAERRKLGAMLQLL
jgi:hypothetical protein